ncbi:hypothetical protein AC579_4562 [Pseudocercospora musae]|uniref:F-box domain-containing protein n=1 Tax=Pseudocercospora musae TaxID=113226 RepID=A0A139ITR4_9PEZI|nr:hypothetical protein AC579_4562 [Pseudocercospora musae]
MSLLHLPAELLHTVCLFCSKNGIESLRLTCQVLQRIADEHLLLEIVTCFEYEDLCRVSEIANHASPLLKKNLRSFLFQADAFPADNHWPRHQWIHERRKFFRGVEEETKEFMRELRTRIKTKRNPRLLEALMRYYQRSIDPAVLLRPEKIGSHQQYINLAKEQEELRKRGFSKRILQDLFTACPNITSVAINGGHRLRRNAGLTNLAFLRSLTIPHCHQEETLAYAVKTTLSAAHNSGTKLESLAIGGITPVFVRPTELIDDDSENNITIGIPKDHLYELTSQLKTLRLMFLGEHDLQDDATEFMIIDFHSLTAQFAEGHLVSWLENCTQIQDLRLDLPYAPYPHWRVPFEHFLGDNLHFPSLRVLHLQSFQTQAERLAEFLLRHKASLVELELSDIHLSLGSWPDCLAQFAGKLEKLQRAKVTGFLTSFNGTDEWVTLDFYSSRVEPSATLERSIIEGGEIVLPQPVINVDVETDSSESEDSDGDEDDHEAEEEDDEEEQEDDDDDALEQLVLVADENGFVELE